MTQPSPSQPRQLIATGFTLDPPYPFNTQRPYCGCSLCGEVFQSDLDRSVPPNHIPSNSLIARIAYDRRLRWRREHTCSHNHKRNGTFTTPEAAQKLARYGIFSLVDLVMDDEISQALKEAP